MIIAAKAVNQTKTKRYCESCHHVIRGKHIRLFGAAMEGDPPYAIYLHWHCVGSGENAKENAKIQKALNEID